DPIRAKADGRRTNLPDELDNLFPDQFDEDDLPRGWRKTALADCVNVIKGNSYKSTDLRPSASALVTLKSFKRGGGYRLDGLKAFAGPYKPAQTVEPGELLVAATDVTQAAEVVGQTALVERSEAFRTLIASLDVFILRPKKKIYPWFLELFLQGHGFPS